MKSAAIYARVSSERQKEERTVASQTGALCQYAQNEGYTVPGEWIFEDEGYSGAMLARPGLERIRDLASEGQIHSVLVYSPDRLSRKYAYQVLLIEEFSANGVEVVFINSPKADTPEEQLLLQFQGMIAEYERAQIAERSRRGKRHRARNGEVSVLSGAPFGYRYIKKTDACAAYYEILEKEAEVVRMIFQLYTEKGESINGISCWLNERKIGTRFGKSLWERSTVWGILRNPTYMGKACFGKTEVTERKKITRRLRMKGGYSSRCSCSRERPREEWIEIPVPEIVSEETFSQAEELLERNKRFSKRRTNEPTLLQGILVCSKCGYAIYRTSTRTSKRKIYYYRCIGSDNYRFENGRVCNQRPIRQDELDAVVWDQVVRLLENPALIREEMDRRLREIRDSNPSKRRMEVVKKELIRTQKGIGKLLDAYQEDLIQLQELRKRMPDLRKREMALKSELHQLKEVATDSQTYLRLAEEMEGFLQRLRSSKETLDVLERQKILRLLVKEVQVGRDTIRIKHSIPVVGISPPEGSSGSGGGSKMPCYLLRKGSHDSALRRPFLPWLQASIWHHNRRLQPALYVQYDPLLTRKAADSPHHQIVVQIVEETLDVHVNHPVRFEAALTRHSHRLQRRLARPVTVRIRVKQRIHFRFEIQLHNHLRNSIRNGRNPQGTTSTVLLRNLNPFYRRREIRPRRHPVPDLVQIVIQVLLKRRKRHPVNPGRALVPLHALIRLLNFPFGNHKRFAPTHAFLPRMVDAQTKAR